MHWHPQLRKTETRTSFDTGSQIYSTTPSPGDQPSKRGTLAKLSKCLRQQWIGCKGERYTLTPLCSEGAWSCIRRGKDGSTKKFTLWLDEPSGFVWWGSWTYYFDPDELSETAFSIGWHKASGEKADFVWRSASANSSSRADADGANVPFARGRRTDGAESEMAQSDEKTSAVDGATVFTSFFRPGIGFHQLPKGWRAPPGLEAAPGVELFVEPPHKHLLDGKKSGQTCPDKGEQLDYRRRSGSACSTEAGSEVDLSEADDVARETITFKKGVPPNRWRKANGNGTFAQGVAARCEERPLNSLRSHKECWR
mmetsp:Transcript_42683/g.117789  ORF Transcript_42683/g.117789 Transcript_42683/m.117789 type:complete len:311 (-) Transcript_42683:93-1025(-)